MESKTYLVVLSGVACVDLGFVDMGVVDMGVVDMVR